jgi:hypothetical protein
MAPSPVELFRMLILTNATGREQFLATKSPAARKVIEAKLSEYQAVTVQQREEKLRSLQLRWQALQMMPLKPAERAQRLAGLPPADGTNIQRLLGPWDILPPPLQEEVLTNDLVKKILVQGTSERSTNAWRNDEERNAELRKQQLLSHFPEFFELSAAEQNKALSKLTATDREQMEKTLSNFTKMSKAEREEALEGFKKFAELSEPERIAFLKTAERWRTMSANDRHLWRMIVNILQRAKSNQDLPLPQMAKPPEPPSVAATNLNN